MPGSTPPNAIPRKAVAHDLDRNRLILVGEQRHLRGVLEGPRDLTYDTDVIDDRIAGPHTVVGPDMQHDLVREPVA